MPLALRLRKNATICTISAQTWSTESTWWSWTGRFQSWDGHRRVSKNGNSIKISGDLLARRCETGSRAGVSIFNRLVKCAHIFIGSKEVGHCGKLISIGHSQNRNFRPSRVGFQEGAADNRASRKRERNSSGFSFLIWFLSRPRCSRIPIPAESYLIPAALKNLDSQQSCGSS